MEKTSISRRTLLKGAVVAAGAATAGSLAGPGVASALLSDPVRTPGSLPFPKLPEGIDLLPQIEHIVVVMMENHSYDSYFGMLPRGNGFRLGPDGGPLNSNPDGLGHRIRSFHMPSTCQLDALPGQDWNRSHTSWNDGRNDGFVKASTPVAMGYWDGTDIPFYYALANTFPLCDRWFGSPRRTRTAGSSWRAPRPGS